jgi:hypothetical protein
MEVVIFLQHRFQVETNIILFLLIEFLIKIDLKNLLQMFTIHNNISVAYQCCSTTLRIILKYRNISSSSDDLIEHLNTALAVLLAEVIQSNSMKELQVCFIHHHFEKFQLFFLEYIKSN